MAETMELGQRIKAEFEAQQKRSREAEQDRAKESREREERLALFNRTCDELKSIWRPRLEEFARQFGEQVKMTPTLTPTLRQAKAVFLTDLASVTLTFTVSASPDLRKLVLEYDLLILPMFFEYERFARLEVPLDAIDRDAIAAWVDDRLVSCVKVYLSLRENQLYLRRAMVQDPVTGATFLPEDAKAKLEHAGKTYYFVSEESLQKFKEAHAPTPEAKPSAAAPAPEPKVVAKAAEAPSAPKGRK